MPVQRKPHAQSSPRAVTVSPERTVQAIELVNRGAACMAHNQLSMAEQCFRQAIALCPLIPEAHNNLGSALREQGRIADAQAAFMRAIQLRPRYASAHSNWLFTEHYKPGQTLKGLRLAHEQW